MTFLLIFDIEWISSGLDRCYILDLGYERLKLMNSFDVREEFALKVANSFLSFH